MFIYEIVVAKFVVWLEPCFSFSLWIIECIADVFINILTKADFIKLSEGMK